MGQLVGLPGSGARSPAQPGLQPAAPPPHPPHTNRKQVAKPGWLQAGQAVTPPRPAPGPAPSPAHIHPAPRRFPSTSAELLQNASHMQRPARPGEGPGTASASRMGTQAARPPPPSADAPFWGSGGSAASRQARARRPGLCRRSAAGAVAGGPARLSRARSASVCSGTRSRLPHVLLGPRPAPSCGRAPNTAGEGSPVPATSHHGSRTHPPSLPALCLYC